MRKHLVFSLCLNVHSFLLKNIKIMFDVFQRGFFCIFASISKPFHRLYVIFLLFSCQNIPPVPSCFPTFIVLFPLFP